MPDADSDPSARTPSLALASAEAGADADRLAAQFLRHDAAIGVIGLGYVGLPLAQPIGGKGFRVAGFDIDPAKVELLNAGQSYIRHILSACLAALGQKGLFSATGDSGGWRRWMPS
jgi:UDP-N-acetyl-D-glucosamine dehydrogenase